MAGMRVTVLLDTNELSFRREEHRRMEALVVTPQARRKGKVVGLVEPMEKGREGGKEGEIRNPGKLNTRPKKGHSTTSPLPSIS